MSMLSVRPSKPVPATSRCSPRAGGPGRNTRAESGPVACSFRHRPRSTSPSRDAADRFRPTQQSASTARARRELVRRPTALCIETRDVQRAVATNAGRAVKTGDAFMPGGVRVRRCRPIGCLARAAPSQSIPFPSALSPTIAIRQTPSPTRGGCRDTLRSAGERRAPRPSAARTFLSGRRATNRDRRTSASAPGWRAFLRRLSHSQGAGCRIARDV